MFRKADRLSCPRTLGARRRCTFWSSTFPFLASTANTGCSLGLRSPPSLFSSPSAPAARIDFQSFDSCAGSLILSDATRNLAMRHRPNELAELAMKSVTIAAIVLACAISAGEVANAQSALPGQLQPCMARVVYSEELPFAPIDSWLVKVTLQVIPRSGAAYFTTLQERMPWQGPPPRRGQAYRVWCDPANPNHLQLASGAVGKSAF